MSFKLTRKGARGRKGKGQEADAPAERRAGAHGRAQHGQGNGGLVLASTHLLVHEILLVKF